MKRQPARDLLSRQREVTNRRRLQSAKFNSESYELADRREAMELAKLLKLSQQPQPSEDVDPQH